jgi:kinetochore protein Nuf2
LHTISLLVTCKPVYCNIITCDAISQTRIDFAEAAKVPAFSSRDVFLPEPDRTRVILSAFINYIKFCEQNAPIIAECQKTSTNAIEERKKVMRELDEAKMQIASLK